jgi:putative hydrolase of the HAD superfamily
MDEICTWIFDLDDTLYEERDYVLSALCHVGEAVERLYGQNAFAKLLLRLSEQRHPDPITQAWSQCMLPEAERSSMIATMRSHMPVISLSAGAQAVLTHLRQQSRPYAIVTDGRSITQRAKIAALGCTDAAYVSISDEVGLSKLDPARFAAVANALPLGHYCYVGDNPAKDFFAPKQLGWQTIMLDLRGQGVHAQHLPDDPAYHPDHIVTDLREILNINMV